MQLLQWMIYYSVSRQKILTKGYIRTTTWPRSGQGAHRPLGGEGGGWVREGGVEALDITIAYTLLILVTLAVTGSIDNPSIVHHEDLE